MFSESKVGLQSTLIGGEYKAHVPILTDAEIPPPQNAPELCRNEQLDALKVAFSCQKDSTKLFINIIISPPHIMYLNVQTMKSLECIHDGGIYNDYHLCTCTNEPTGEDLCAR